MPITVVPATGGRALAVLMLAAAMAAGLTPAAAQTGSVMSRAEYEACQAQDEKAFESAVARVTTKALRNGVEHLDYKALVLAEWKKSGLDEIVEREVTRAVKEVREETSWGSLLESIVSTETAQQLAVTVAERVYKSERMRQALEALAVGVGTDLAKRIEFATADAADPAMQCIQAFLGPRYGKVIARVVSHDAGREFGVDPSKGGANVSPDKVILGQSGAITGAVLIIVRRQLARMAQRVGQRVVGAVLSRIVAVVSSGVGLVLIAKDVWELRHGVLPIIETEMKSKDTKDKVQDELAKTIQEQILEHLQEIGAKTAERVVEVWREYQKAHAKVLELAERHVAFREFVDGLGPRQLPLLNEIVAIVLPGEGEAGVLARVTDGTLKRAVTDLPAAAIDIARETRSLGQAFEWMRIAGDRIIRVHELEIWRRAKPDDFTTATLTRLLRLDDPLAIQRLAALARDAREQLAGLDDKDLKGLARTLSETELTALSTYLGRLARPAAERLLRAVAYEPRKMELLAAKGVREGIVASADHLAAVAMMLRAESLLDPTVIVSDFRLVREGRVNAWLFWEKHPVPVALAGLAVLILLIMLKRLIFPRRQRIIVRGPPPSPPSPPPAAPPKGGKPA